MFRRRLNHFIKFPFFFSLFLVLFISTKTAVSAANYYVSPSGFDTNPGTLDSPFKTITKGVGVVSPGDTVYVRAGTYKEQVVIRKSGKEGAPITLSAYPGERPVIDGEYALPAGVGKIHPTNGVEYYWDSLIRINSDYTIVSGFEVVHSRGRGIAIWSGHHDEINENQVHDCRLTCVDILGSIRPENQNFSDNYSTNNVIKNNRLWNCIDYAPYDRTVDSALDWPAALAVFLGRNVLIKGNTVYNSWGKGILFYISDHGVVEDNVLYDNWGGGIYAERASDVTIQRNLVYHTNDPKFRRAGNASWGILIADETQHLKYPSNGENKKVLNNLIAGCTYSFIFARNSSSSAGLKNAVIANNTFINAISNNGNPPLGMRIDDSTHSNVLISNNIVQQNTGVVAQVANNPELKFSNNLWSRPVASHVSSLTDIIGDPKLTLSGVLEPGKLTADYFKLKSDSPAIGRGIVLSDVNQDFFGIPRGKSPSFGAIEYSSSLTPSSSPTIPPSPTTPPTTCPLKSQGDADCNGKIDDQDYSIWLNSQCRPGPGQACVDTKADFNGDGKVDDDDLEVWKKMKQ